MVQPLRLILTFLAFSVISFGYAQVRTFSTLSSKTTAILDSNVSKLKRRPDSLSSTFRSGFTGILKAGKESTNTRVQQRFKLLKDIFQVKKDSSLVFRLPPPIRLGNGQISLIQQVARREGAYPVFSPANYTRFMFNGGVSILGIPLAVHALYSTEQSTTRQPMNRIGVSLDMEGIRTRLKQRIDSRLKALEQVTRTDDLLDLDSLQQLYKAHQPDINQLNQLPDFGRMLSIDELRQSANQQLKQESEDFLTQAADSAHRIKKEKSIQAKKQLARKIEPTATERIKARRWQQKWDSLQQTDPERLLRYREISALRTLKKEGLSTADGFRILKEWGLLSKSETWLSSVRSFGVGTSYPSYSHYTLRNLPISGFHIQLQPGILYLAYTASKNLQAIPEQNVFARSIQALQTGVGRKEGSHLYINFLYGKDNKNSFRGDTLWTGILDTSFYTSPRENLVLGSDFRLQLRKWLALEGEVAHALTAMDTYQYNFSSLPIQSRLFASSLDTNGHSGGAYNLQLKTNVGKHTHLNLKTEIIDRGFHSLGTPYLRNDISGYEVNMEQYLWKRQLLLSPSFGQWRDNLSGTRLATTYMDSYGLKAKVAFKQKPYLAGSYLSNHMQSNRLFHSMNLLHLQTGHHYRLSNLSAQTTLIAFGQKTQSRLLNGHNHVVKNLQWNQLISFTIPISLMSTLAWMDAHGMEEHNRQGQAGGEDVFSTTLHQNGTWLTFGGSFSYTFRGRWENRIGFSEGTSSQEGKKQNRFIESRVQLGKYGDLSVRMEKNVLQTGDAWWDYKELMGIATLTSRF